MLNVCLALLKLYGALKEQGMALSNVTIYGRHVLLYVALRMYDPDKALFV